MFNAFYRLNENPFSPDLVLNGPYLSESHAEALTHLNYGVSETGGFILLTGDEGSGKTTLLSNLIEHLPKDTDVAVIHNPAVNEIELLADLCDALSIEYHESNLKHLIDCLSTFLQSNHDKGRRSVLVIDNAQHLSNNLLEQLRLLTNLETDTQKLLQIILVGRPELKRHLNQQALRQVAQRITVRYHLAPLKKTEILGYIAHRLRACGLNEPLFKHSAIKLIAKYSAGNPKLINQLSERVLMTAYGQSQSSIDGRITQVAIAEALGTDKTKPGKMVSPAVAASLMLTCILGYGIWQVAENQLAPESLTAQRSAEPLTVQRVNLQALTLAIDTVTPTKEPLHSHQRVQSDEHKEQDTAIRAQTALVHLRDDKSENHLAERVKDLQSVDFTEADSPAIIYVAAKAKVKDNTDVNPVSSIGQLTHSQKNWYVVQVYAGHLQLDNLQKFSCNEHELLTRHHDDTFYITSPNLNLIDARKVKQKLESDCQLDSWVKPLPKSWRPLLAATTN